MKKIQTSFTFKVIAVYLALNIIFPLAGFQTGMFNSYALTGGPSQPEFNSFTPIGTSDMVDLASGDFNYNIPIMDVGGYPLNLSYNSGITMDQEASWVGLGWNLNVGQINRNVRGLPDDFDGDVIETINKKKANITTGMDLGVKLSFAGWDFLGLNVGLGFYKNNYTGFYAKPSVGVSFDLSENTNTAIGLDISSTTTGGPTISAHHPIKNSFIKSIGYSYSSREAISSLNIGWGASWSIPNTANASVSISKSANFPRSDYMSFPSSKRIAMKSTNNIYSASVGIEFLFAEVDGSIVGSQSKQSYKNENSSYKAFGYENTLHNSPSINGMLDFNREKNMGSYSKYTSVLPITNYTFDLYSIKGQGVGGLFKPFKSQVGYVFDQTVKDSGKGNTIGLEIGPGNVVHIGVDYKRTKSFSMSSIWNDGNFAISKLKQSAYNNLSNEDTYYKLIGELSVDPDTFNSNNILSNFGGYQPVNIGIGGEFHKRVALKIFKKKNILSEAGGTATYTYNDLNILKRNHRDVKNLSIQKISKKEVINYGLANKFFFLNEFSKKHHTAGFKVLKNDGSSYIFGRAVYNTQKIEATLDVSNEVQNTEDCLNGTINIGNINDGSPSSHSDQFVDKKITPPYAYAYLLTSILSSDYEDINNNGPDDVDLGSYTKFNYNLLHEDQYKWRFPFNKAYYSEGLKSSLRDQKANYIYGEKQLQFVESIETKTHIAVFNYEQRKDGFGVDGEAGGIQPTSFNFNKKIKSIQLYSKPDYLALGTLATPIKTVHFEYDYSLCPNVDNNSGAVSSNSETEPNNNDGEDANLHKGKLTLKKVYFTYGKSRMGKYTPYIFNYNSFNPEYHPKDQDIWGNFKENASVCGDLTNVDFPFVTQDKTSADNNSSAWSLESIDLPSGGKINLEFESDDYQYVQNKRAMQMFKISGFGDGNENNNSPQYSDYLYNPNHKKYVYINTGIPGIDVSTFDDLFLNEIKDDPIYFNTLLNMSSKSYQYDYVSGYFYIDQSVPIKTYSNGIVAIPLEFYGNEGGWVTGSHSVNPIAKAGWYFGRNNLNGIVYRDGEDYVNSNFKSVINEITSAIDEFKNVFNNANQVLEDKGIARKIKSDKSWIRLLNPNKSKYGGGSRIKKLEMYDNWDEMTNNLGNDLYKQKYGQEYFYKLEDGSSSGVATFEPNKSKENPFVTPFFNKDPDKKDRLVAPSEFNYVEKPLGESFFPNASITYSRVSVKNLERIKNISGVDKFVKDHATGKVVNEFFTSQDFPTISNYTDITTLFDPPTTLGKFLSVNVMTHQTMSQGFVIHTNDMNGKIKSQMVYQEGKNNEISKVTYIYSIDNKGKLDNYLPTIDDTGQIRRAIIGQQYDIINDFNQIYSYTRVGGGDVNFEFDILAVLPLTMGNIIPDFARHEDKVSTATTTKVIHTSGVLVEKIAEDLGSKVSTKNLAWDAKTGQVLVTKTKNEYNDSYYSINYPAYWKYKQMGLASNNINIEGVLTKPSNGELFILTNAKDYFIEGDELQVKYLNSENEETYSKFWVSSVQNNQVILMDELGKIVNSAVDGLASESIVNSDMQFKIYRSGYRNLQTASMASITTMTNPIYTTNEGEDSNGDGNIDLQTHLNDFNKNKIINASAIEYSNLWSMKCDCLNVPSYTFTFNTTIPIDDDPNVIQDETNVTNDTPSDYASIGLNPYLYNVKGNFKAVKSYAFLTTRTTSSDSSPRHDGFFNNFSPFYDFNSSVNKWEINRHLWTFASRISLYSPYGVELENTDALNRHSSAQYGYNYTLPTAVSSNSKYTEMGFDGFEDYQSSCLSPHFSYKQAIENILGNAEIINNQSHTGNHSLKVKGNSRATLEKRIDSDCNQ